MEVDFRLLRTHGERMCGGVFHVEHYVDFVMGLAARTEADLGHGEQWANGEREAHFLEAFAGQCARGGLIEFDVPAREVEVALLDVAAEEHGVIGWPAQKCASEELDLPIICHAAELVLCGTRSTMRHEDGAWMPY